MFLSPLRSPRGKDASTSEQPAAVPAVAATELAIEFASLRAPNGCPRGIYITPSTETIMRWHGVFFVHHGPYAGSVLRFTISFTPTFPQSPPAVRFDSDVFHPMVDPKTKLWRPQGRLKQRRPRVDHVPHLLHHLKASFRSGSLDRVTEEEAANKQVWSLYHHSRQTFLSMTAQRSIHSSSRGVLYPDTATAPATPGSAPTTPTRVRTTSMQSISEEQGLHAIKFRALDEAERERLWSSLKGVDE
ncbi:hypothetical protein IAU60_004115 [Kwoniella sp. DSM 27419]